LILAQFYPPDIGGEERHAHNLAVGLAGRGHEVSVITSHLPGTPVGRSLEDGVVVERVVTSAQTIPWLHSERARPHALPVADPAMRRAIDAALGRDRFDVIHAHNWIVNSAIGPARVHGVPVVLTLHDYSHVCATKRFMRFGAPCTGPAPARCVACAARHFGGLTGPAIATANAFERLVRERSISTFVAVSQSVAHRNLLPLRGVTFEVVPNFIPDEQLVTHAVPAPGGPLLFAGDRTRDKGTEVLFAAYERLRDRPPLHLVGRHIPGVGERPPEGVTLIPPCPHEAVVTMMRSARAVTVPSIVPDSCPTVVLEAMAAGRPVVATATGGILDLVADGETGLLVPPGDPLALAVALQRLLDTPALADAMGNAALERARQFTASAVIERIERIYANAAIDGPAGEIGGSSSNRHGRFRRIEDVRHLPEGVS
jgi:glycosyltransferase involved in cell wall biosynthesis